jgi:hypothetical protein
MDMAHVKSLVILIPVAFSRFAYIRLLSESFKPGSFWYLFLPSFPPLLISALGKFSSSFVFFFNLMSYSDTIGGVGKGNSKPGNSFYFVFSNVIGIREVASSDTKVCFLIFPFRQSLICT